MNKAEEECNKGCRLKQKSHSAFCTKEVRNYICGFYSNRVILISIAAAIRLFARYAAGRPNDAGNVYGKSDQKKKTDDALPKDPARLYPE